jgi:TATA-box binding protein (TBP) (component of TFIID and TFIIIB)
MQNQFDLDQLATFLPGTRPVRFCAFVCRPFPATRCAFLVFKSGRVVLTGVRRLDEVHDWVHKFILQLESFFNHKVDFTKPILRNSVYRTQFVGGRETVNLTFIYSLRYLFTHLFFVLEPESFPAIQIFDKSDKTCILIFSTKKIMITGVKNDLCRANCLDFLHKLASYLY